MNPRRIGFLGYDDVQTLDIVGPVDPFMTARLDERDGSDGVCYETFIIGLSDKPFCVGIGNNSWNTPGCPIAPVTAAMRPP